MDVQPIRASCFNPKGKQFALGTNSKSLKICTLPNMDDDDGDDNEGDQDAGYPHSHGHHGVKKMGSIRPIEVIFE